MIDYNGVKMLEEMQLSLDDVLLRPRYSGIESRLDTDLETNLAGICLSIPIVSAAMDTISEVNMAVALGKLGGAAFLHRFKSDEDILSMVKDISDKSVPCIPSIGIRDDILSWVGRLVQAGADAVSLDIAHGDHINAIKTIDNVKKHMPGIVVIAGNVSTRGGTRRLIRAGADVVKVNVGPGSLCKTRTTTGFGTPTFSAICECASEAEEHGVPVIADGGFKVPGDFTKALAAGASACMTGSLFAGVAETPGEIVKIGDDFYKSYRGMASYEAQVDFKGGLRDGTATEGEATLVKCEGCVKDVVNYVCGGIRSGLTYAGARDLDELRKNAIFMRITSSAIVEGTPHLLSSTTKR